MPKEIITLEDLQNFKVELLNEITELLEKTPSKQRKWLKSHHVREILGISPGTLQNMRINGIIPFTKIGGLIFYDHDDICNLVEPKLKKKVI